MTTAARAERDALCDLFLEVGPDSPTLCEGWTTRDLAAHLVVRERRPDAAAGIVVPPLAPHAEKVRAAEAARPWDELVARVRSGPPSLSPARLDAVDRLVNTSELFVHHEDVRRATEPWVPRPLSDELARDLLAGLRRGARLLGRRAPAGLVLVTPDGERITAKRGGPVVEASGEVGELVLWLFGRQTHASVALSGPAEVVERTRAARFGV